MGEKFVNLRIVTSDKAYPDFRKAFGVVGTPTVLFLDSQGDEIDRIVGYGGEKDEYFQKVQDYAAGKNTLRVLLAEYEGKADDVEANFAMGRKYLDRRETDKAVPFFEKVLALDPENAKGHRVEATYRIALNEAREKQNVEPLKAFIASDPEEEYLSDAYNTLASAYMRRKDTDSMVATYEAALERFPENARMMFSYSASILRAKLEDLYPKALELNEKVRTLDPEAKTATMYNLITYYQNIGDTEKLIETFEGAIAEEPESSGLLSYYASTINSQGIESHYDRGIDVIKKAIELNAVSWSYWYTLSLLYEKKGEQEQAIEAVKKAMELSPDNPRLKQVLDKLEGTEAH